MNEAKQKRVALASALVLANALALALSPLVWGDHDKAMEGGAMHVIVVPDDIKWVDGPPGLPPGGKFAILEGDPSKPAPFTIRGKMPAGYRIPAHWHPTDERVTVLSGSLYMGAGDALDVTKGKKLPPGGFALMPARMRHFAWTDEETILQVNGIGPWAINYVNPLDDPAKNKTTK